MIPTWNSFGGTALCGRVPLIVFVASFSSHAFSQKPDRAGSESLKPSHAEKKSGTKEFAPGIVIDWSAAAVELDAKVVLREGPLELLACSPQTKEHESILVIPARPLNIFQALGLIGLQPGSPPFYDEKQEKWYPASGEPLELRVRWRAGDSARDEPATKWLSEPRTGKPPESLIWVFSGSVMREREKFAADGDGTVAAVVDFDSALISPSVRHSADDEELWLIANKDEIPPVGTRCTLLVRSAYHPRIEAAVTPSGALEVDGKPVDASAAGGLLERNRDHRTPFLLVRVAASAEADKVEKWKRELEAELTRLKLDPRTSLRFLKESAPPTPAPSPSPAP